MLDLLNFTDVDLHKTGFFFSILISYMVGLEHLEVSLGFSHSEQSEHSEDSEHSFSNVSSGLYVGGVYTHRIKR